MSSLDRHYRQNACPDQYSVLSTSGCPQFHCRVLARRLDVDVTIASVALLNTVLIRHTVQPRPRNRTFQSRRPVDDVKIKKNKADGMADSATLTKTLNGQRVRGISPVEKE